MSEPKYFWQGGRKVEVRQDEEAITLHASDEAEASRVARQSDVELIHAEAAAPGLVRARIATDRDAGMARLRANRNVVHHVYRDEKSPDNEYLITETFFVKFKPGTPPQRIRDYIAGEHLVVEQELGDDTYLFRVTDETGRNPVRTANAAAERDDVEYGEPNLVRQLTRFAFLPPDPGFAEQWHLHAPSAGLELVAGAGIFAADAWDLTIGRRDIVIAVADDGFDLIHPDFQGDGKVVARLNATPRGQGANAAIDWDDAVQPRAGDYHGTPCLGVAVAEGNGTGVIGVAPGCALVAIRFPLSMTDAHFIEMFRKASTLADVISCSWGFGPANAPMSLALRESMATLARTGGRRGKGLVFCIAAGNNNCPVQDLGNTRPYRYRDHQGIIRSYSGPIDRWVAAHPDVITVSASTSLKTRSAYSSWGKNISVCAPSDNWDDLGQISPPGRGITTTDNEGFGFGSDFTPGSRFTSRFGGTSSATPTVAGVCGLVLSANDALSAREVREVIQETADKDLSLESHTPVNEPGDFNAEGFSLWFGHGKVNAFKAVQAALARTDAERLVDVRQDAVMAIPDRGQPIVSAIGIDAAGRIADLRVEVDISHTYIGDLRVDLLAPNGTGIVLHNRSGRSANDLVRSYTADDTPGLRLLQDAAIGGTWQLRVQDTLLADVGQLNSWRLVARVRA